MTGAAEVDGGHTDGGSFEPLLIHRSTVRTWLISLAAVPAIVIGVDVVWRQRLTNWMSERVFTGDPQAIEVRDHIWAWVMIGAGVMVVAWGLKELFAPAPVLRTDPDGVHLRVNGPFRPTALLPWTTLYDVDAGTLEDDDEVIDVLVIEVKDPSVLPANPWAGRRVEESTVALYTTEWDVSAEQAAQTIADQAVMMARDEPRPP